MRQFFRDHGLSITMLGLFFLVFFVGQFFAGFKEYNQDREEHSEPAVSYGDYLRSAHFLEATAENWESEFFQMFIYVFATSFLYQRGSAESKNPRRPHSHKTKIKNPIRPDAPWPVKKGGWILRVYEHSLSLAFLALFLFSFLLHVRGGTRLYNEEQQAHGEPVIGMLEYLRSSRFWFESFQNWQSEFLAIGSMVVLSIWLREKNSPESKEVDDPHWKNPE